MSTIRTLVMAALCFAPIAASADRIDNYVNAELKRQHIPGAWIMVREDGRVLKARGYGFANLEDKTPVTSDTLMQTGSIGKMFTAAGVMLLVKEGKLKLTDSVAAYFPGSPDWWKPITIRNLLTHTGGIPDYEGYPYSVDLKKEYSEDELIKFAQRMRPSFAPGEKWSYSNTDYVILGVLIHKLTGQFYGDFLRDRVWRPSGMPTMRVISDREVIPNRSCGYDWDKDHWLNQDWVSASLNSTADGALYATPADFAAWDKALDTYSVVPTDLQNLMWTSGKLNNGSETAYGFAWAMKDLFGHRAVGHNGAWQGFTASYYRFYNDHLSVAVFTNRSGSNPDKMVFDIAALTGRVPRKEDLKPIQAAPAELENGKSILLALAAGKQPTGPVAGTLAQVPSGALDQFHNMAKDLGEFRNFELVFKSSQEPGYVIYRATFQKGKIWIQYRFNEKHEFVGAQVL